MGGGEGACNSLERRQNNTNRKHHFIQDQIKKMGLLHQALLHLALQSTPYLEGWGGGRGRRMRRKTC